MDALTTEIRAVRPDDPALAPLIEGHLALMRASSPACSVHAMDTEALIAAGVAFFALYEAGIPMAFGALKAIAPDHAEIKSMHVVREARGRGLARRLLDHLLDTARETGCRRVSLETGSQEVFGPARSLYASAGFETCPPFEGYGPDPNSVFMTRVL